MNDEKKYLVQVDDEAELWDSSKMDRNIDALYADFQDADVFELDAYNPDDALDSDQYLVNLDDETEVWDADKWNRNREALMADFPEAKVQRVRYKDYWGEKATATQERIKELEQPDEERNARLAEIGYFDDSLGEANLAVGLKPLSEAIRESATGETTYLDPKVEEFFANDSVYTARLNEIAKLKDEYNANPSVIRQRQYEAEAAKYAAESLNRLEEQILANRKSEVDQYHAAQGAAAKHQYDPYGSNQAVQAIRMMKGEDVGKDVTENEKLEKYDSALKLIQQTKDIYDAVGRGFGAGFADTAQDWLRNAATQSDIEMYNEVGDILSALQDKIGNLNNITEEDIENNLSKEEQALIKAFYEYNHAMASAGKDLSGWYKGGKIFAESIPFMLEFLATGGLSKAAEVGATSALRMAFNRWIRKSAKGTAARIAKQAAKRVAVGGVKLLAGGGVRTLAAPSTYRNMAEKSVEIDEKTGELHRAKNAFVGAVDSYVEQMSEMSGTYFKSIFGGLTKDLGIKALGKVKFDEIGKWFADSATMQKLAKLGFHGLPEEIGEEVFGNALRTLSGVDDEALSRMFEPDELGAMLIGFAPMTLFGAGVSAARMGYVNIAAANAAKRMREDAGRHFEAKQLDEVEALVESCKDANEIAQAIKPVIAGMKTMGASKYEIQSVIDYARAVANKRVMGFAAKSQEMQLSDAKIKETEEQLGNPFWMENKEGGKDVKTVVLNNGKTVFVTSQPDADGRVTYIESGSGKKGMALPSDIKKETWFGSLNAYGAGLVMSERNEREKQRFLEERSKQIGALREKLAVAPKINVGTQGSPIYLVAQSFNDAGVHYVDQNGSTGNLSWEQVGNALGSPIVVESDAQIAYREAEAMVEAAAKRRAEKAKNDELGQAEAASANIDALNAANAVAEAEVNIPKNDDGSVNEVAFWEQDPEGYVKWNDERNKDGGKDSLEQIAVTRDELMVLLSQAQDAQKTSNPVTRKAAKADAEMLAEKIARLDAIEQSYMNALEVEKENVKKTNATPTASMNEEQRENMDTQYQNILGKTRVKAEKVRVMQEYLDKISEGSNPAILMTKEDYVEKMKANGASEVAIEKVRQAVKNGEVAGLMNRGKVYLMMDGLVSIDAGRVTYVHERQHAFNEADLKYIKAVVNAVKGGKAGMMKILEAMAGKIPAKAYKDLSVRKIADEIICRSMEIVYSNENYSVALQKLGVPSEVISIITEIDNEQRNVLNLAHARRRGRLDRHDDQGGRGSNQQDVGDLGQIPGGVLGEQGAGPSGVGETGTRDGESGEESGTELEESDSTPLRVVEPEDNLTEATKEELAEKGLVMDGGAIMSDDYAALKNETGYLTPIERDTDVDSVKFSHVTMPGWKKNYLTYQDAEKRVIQYLEAFADRITANELVSGIVAQGQHKSSKKTKDGKLVEAGPLRSNISYVVTFDLDTTCPRTFQYLNYVRRIEKRIGRPLTQIECIQLNEMMRMYGQQIPCVYCYAENKRQAMKQYFNNYIAARHAVLSAETDEEALKHMYGREKEGDNPKAVLTEAAYKVFKKWRSNPKGFYNPTMKVLWYQYNQARNSVLTLLDMRYADGSVKASSADDTIADAIALELGVTNKTAVRAIEEIVAEWKWNTIEEKPHDDFTPVDEDDIWANQNALEVWRDMTLYAKSASGAKNVNRYVPYTDELKHVDQATRDYINGMGGVRMHSTNDFRIDYVFDYFQFMADMAANKMLGHTYTKSPEFVRIFGNSGYKINMSIAAYQDENGNIRPNVDEGFDWEEAKMLRQYFGNAGTMLMATSDEQLQMALDSDWIDMCIPFHHSGLPKSVWYNMRLWTDYTTTQNERYFNTEEKIAMLKEDGVELPKKSSKVSSEDYTNWVEETFNEHFNITVRYGKDGKRVKPHFLPGPTIVNGVNIPGHNNDHQTYLDLCRQWGVKPRFEGIKVKDNTPEGGGRIVDITQHPRYMILVKETARTDTPQTPIMFNFDEPSEALGGKTPLDYAFEELEARAMSESELAGEQVRDIYTSLKKDQFGIVDQFLNTIIRHKEETGEEYPMDYLTPESREWFMVQRKALEEAFKDMDYIPYHRNEYDEQGNLISGPGLEREEPESIMAAAKEVAEKQPKKAKKPGKKSKKADDVMLRTADQPAESMRVQPHESSLYEIEYYFNALNSKPELVPLFEKVKNICDLLGTDFKFVSEKEMAALQGKKSSTAEGIAWGNKIRINADAWNNTSNQSSAETILHEMIHVCTSYMLWAEEDSLPENVLAAKREIESIYDVVKDKYRSYYAATNSHEMLAEMSNPWFRVSLKKGNLWERFINMNRVLFGFEPKDNNRFDAVDAALNAILDNPDFSLFYEMEPDSEEYVAFSFVPRTEEQREQLFDKARAKYGVTNNFNATGYMLPDGSLLDFSEANDGGDPNSRSLDHRDIEGIIMDEGREYESRFDYVADFVDEGAIRMLPEYAGFQLAVRPTQEQRGKLMDYIYKHNGEVIMEITDESGRNAFYKEYDRKTSPARIFRDMDNYFGNGDIPGNDDDVRFRMSNENQAIFVSNAAKAVESIKQEKATPEQWLKMIEKNGGLKAGEDKWMGLSDWLNASDKKTLTKDEVLDFINENMIVIEEQHYGDINEEKATMDEIADRIVEGRSLEELQEMIDENAESASRYDDEAEDEDFNLDEWLMDRMIEEFGDDFGEFYTIQDGYVDQVEQDWWDRDEDAETLEDENGVRRIHSMRENYTTKGLKNNREIALTIPTIASWGSDDYVHFGDAGEGRAVAWIRFGETTDESGNRVLVIDEIQSKRHQEGREKGYMSTLTNATNKAKREADSFERYLEDKYGESYREALEAIKQKRDFDKLEDLLTEEEYTKRMDLHHDVYLAKEAEQINSSYIPDAPFEKNWHELAMKRMLRYAAEKGYDYIAWTKGAQQAERYNIGNYVSSIEMQEEYDGNRDFGFYMGDSDEALTVTVDENGTVVSAEGHLSQAEGRPLADLVGKEMAVKMMQMEEYDVLEDTDLNIGNKGMEGFYDKMLPAFMNKYGKKWGVKVEDINLPNLEDGLTMHSVPVTEEMKASVMEGQVMFRTVDITPEVAAEMEDIKKRTEADGTFMKAPNGEATNLTEEQWLMVRTKNFVRWFGDWLKPWRIEKLRNSKPIEVKGDEYVGNYELNKKSAQKYIINHLKDQYTNKDTGEKIQVSNIGAQKVTSHGYNEPIHLASIMYIPRMIEEAIFITEEPNTKRKNEFETYRYYVCGLKIDGEDYTAKLVVGVSGKKTYYDHDLSSIEKGKLIDSRGLVPTRRTDEESTLSGIKDTRLLSILQNDFSKVIAENGEPMVIWRGMTWDIMEEPDGKAIMNDSSYFSDSAYVSRKFGDYSYPYFMNARNPYIMSAAGASWANIPIEYAEGLEVEPYDMEYPDETGIGDIAIAAAEKGYDAVWVKDVDDMGGMADQLLNFKSNQIKAASNNTGDFSEANDDVRFSIRTKPAPKKTGIGYKVFYLKDGKLYPPMVANLGGVDTPMHVWLDAEEGVRAGVSKTGRPQVKQGGKGTQGGSGKLAYRPGWHLGEIPYAIQFNRKDENGERTLFPADFVWAEVEYADDVDYQDKAMSYGMNANGKFQHSLAGLPEIPVDGSYRYRTNPNPETDPWIITGAMKVRRLLTPSKVDEMVIAAGKQPQKRQEGAVTDEQINALNEASEAVVFRLTQAVDHKALREISSLRSFRFGFNELQKAIGSTVAGEEQVVNSLRAKKNPTAYDKERLRRAELDLAAARKAMQWWESVNERLVDDARVEPDYKAALQDMEPRNTFEFLSVFFTMQTARVSKMFVDDEGKGVMKKVNEKTGIMLSPETLRQELGWSTGDWAKMKYIVSASKGRSLDEIAEMISEDADAQTFFYGMDTMEIKDEVIDFLQSMESYAAIRDYIKTQREREAREIADDINARIGVVVDEIEQSGMTIEEYNAAVIDEAYKEVEEQLEMLDQSEIYGNFENLTDEEYERYLEAVIRGEEGRTSESTEDLSESEDASEDISEEAEGESSAGAPGGNRNDSGNVGNRPDEAGEYAGPALGDKKQGVVSPSGAIDTEGLSVDEIVETGTMKAAEANAEAVGTYLEKVHKINDGLASIRTALAAQKSYDEATVKIVTDLANSLLEGGRLADLTRGEIKRIISVVKSANGKEDLSVVVYRLLDIMIANQLRNGRERVEQLMKVKATKVNATGVEVRGSMDIAGQQMMDAFKKGIASSMTDQMLSDKIAEAENDLSSESEVLRRNAENELAGYYLAREYRENILASISEEELLRDLIKDAKKQYDAGAADKRSYKEYIASCYEAIRENRMQRVAAYENMAAVLAGKIADSVMNAKLLNAREQARIENIHHMANSDMQGMPSVQQGKVRSKFWNSSIIRFLFKPLVTFDQMLRSFAPKSRYGEGYLWNHFMGGWLKASENEYKGVQAAHETLDARAKALFGVQRWSDLFKVIKKLPKMTVEFWDGEKMADFELTQGNLLYIYMVNKMVDGQMKLRKMGITEEDVDKIARSLDPRLIELADWVQDSFLPLQREKYNAVHERLFGAPMAAIDNYFPIRVLANARTREVDVAVEETNAKPATSTGSIIKRTKNSLALDILGSDAIDVVLEHIEEMEKWAAFAEFNKDLNTLLSYNKFRNRVQNMLGIYGAGETVWNNFRSAAEIAAGVYKPAVKGDSIDKLITNVAKGVTGAKISFRVYTAIKQILSAPAFVSDASMASLLKNVANPAKAWNWAMDNLPLFEKRWKSRQAGDSRLMETEADWELWTNKVVELAGRVGMTPNAFVDAVTVSLGAKAIYDTKLQEYLDYGYSQERAEEKAKRDATVLFNESQQSNESAFLSPAQVDRTVASILITVFRNSSMGYQRMYVDALRNIKHMMKKGYKAESLEYMTKQMVRDGLTPEQAERAAERIYNRSFARNAARVATFGFLVQFAWNLGPYMVYLLMGDDDEEKKDMIMDAAVRGLVGGPVEGLAAGQAISSLLGDIAMGEKPSDPTIKLPATSDIESLFKTLEHDPVRAVNDIVNLLVQSGIGVNPQTLTDAVVAIVDASNGDLGLAKETAFALMRVLQTPQSQIEKLYLDEIGFTEDEVYDMTVKEFAERYAKYKVMRNAPLTKWMYSDEREKELEDKYIKQFTQKAKDIRKERGSEEAQAWYGYIEGEYEESKQKIKDLNAAIKDGSKEAAKELSGFHRTPEGQRYYKAKEIEGYTKSLKELEGRHKESLNDKRKEAFGELMQMLEQQ